jgi:transcriptional regulator with XRE-family HTH domain
VSEEFGKLLRGLRNENSLTQENLVEKLKNQGYEKYSKADISKWETGRTKPSEDVVEALEDILLSAPNGMLLKAAGYNAAAELRGRAKDDLAETRVGQKAAQDLLDVAAELNAQLSTPSPEFFLIDDLGGLGDNSCRLRQEGLIVVLENLSHGAGFKAASTTTTWGASLPTETEVFWTVSSSGSVERYCPIERDLSFQRWFASVPNRLKQEFARWKYLGGSYLAECSNTRMEIQERAKNSTLAGLIDNVTEFLSRLSPTPPEPMTINFGNLVYQLAVEYNRSSGTRGVPDEISYCTLPADPPIFVKLVLGQARIHLATSLPGVAQNWADLHRKMIVEWGKSQKIGMLVDLFHDLQDIEETIKKELN